MAKKSLLSFLRANLGEVLSVVGLGVAIGGVYLADLYNERQARNEQLRFFCGLAVNEAAKCQSGYAALCSKAEWAEIKPLADREQWAQAIAAGLGRISEARKSVCREGAKDMEACQEVTDTVKEEMSGLSDHMLDVVKASSDRAGTKESLRRELSESTTLLRQAEKLLGEPKSLWEGGDRTVVANIKHELAGITAQGTPPFSELYLNSRTAARSAERLRWLVERLTADQAIANDEWVAKVVDSRPAYVATVVRYTWDNSRDFPPVSTVESTVEISKDVYETIRSSNGQKLADARPTGGVKQARVSDEVAAKLGLPALAQAPYPYADTDGEMYLEDCSEAQNVTFSFRFKGRRVERTALVYKRDLGSLYPLTAAQSFVLKERQASTEYVEIPVWLAQTWSQVYNQRTAIQGGI